MPAKLPAVAPGFARIHRSARWHRRRMAWEDVVMTESATGEAPRHGAARLGRGLGVLAAQGITVARVERFGRLGTLGVVAANVSLGVLLVGLKLVVSH